MVTLWMVGGALASSQTLWLDVKISDPEQTVMLAVPYSWVAEGVVSDGLLATLQAREIDLAEAAGVLGAAPVGSRQDWVVEEDGQTMELTLHSRPVPEGVRAKRLVVESTDDRLQLPLFVARAASKWVDASALGPVTDWVVVDEAMRRLGRVEPFTLVDVALADGEHVRVSTW